MKIAPMRSVVAIVLIALSASVLIIAYGSQRLRAPAALEESRAKWSKLMGTNSVFLPKAKKHSGLEGVAVALHAEGMPARTTKLTAARFQELSEVPAPTKVPVEDVYEEYNMCQSCLMSCKMFEEEKCGFNVLKEACLPDVLMEGCAECEGKGCAQVVEFLNENEALNATAEGGDNITRLEIFTELVWDHAQVEAVRTQSCEFTPSLAGCSGAAAIGSIGKVEASGRAAAAARPHRRSVSRSFWGSVVKHRE